MGILPESNSKSVEKPRPKSKLDPSQERTQSCLLSQKGVQGRRHSGTGRNRTRWGLTSAQASEMLSEGRKCTAVTFTGW